MPAAVALVFGASFTALAGLVAAGSASRIDAYAVHHWMPGLVPASAAHEPSLTGALLPFYGLHSPGAVDLASTVVTLPGYILVSSALFAAGLLLLWRRGRAVDAAVWAAAFVAGNLAEVVSKSLLVRPALSAPSPAGPVHLVAFDSSYPSGHTLRACLLAALAVSLWRRLWPYAVCWVAATLVLLVAAGAHTVTDVAGGALLAGFLIALATWATCRRAVRGPLASRLG